LFIGCYVNLRFDVLLSLLLLLLYMQVFELQSELSANRQSNHELLEGKQQLQVS